MSIFKDLGLESAQDRLPEEVLYNFAACYALLEKSLSQVLAEVGLSPVKLNVLLMLRHVNAGQGLSQVEISKRMVVTAGNTTRLVDRLEKDGFAKRIASEEDRRVKRVCITKAGETALDAIWPTYQAKVAELMGVLGKKDQQYFADKLNAFRYALGAMR